MSMLTFRSFVAFLVLAAAPAPSGKPPSWKQIDQLIHDQQMQKAQDGARARLEVARRGTDEAEWTHALVKVVQLEVALHGYETAVRILSEEPRPKGVIPEATLDLFYAAVLGAYENAYDWEINQRERVESKGPIDLKLWTMDQLRAEQSRAYARVWQHRQELGNQPISVLKEYVQPNNYPAGVRSTLRDAVSYLWVELLGNTASWRPEHANEVFQLDLAGLIQGNPAASAKVKLDDPDVHPLIRVGAILDDLEAWHLEKKQADAALEARLERLRRLHAAFTTDTARQQIRDHLAQRLPMVKDTPWFSMGMHTLATFWSESGNLVRAHQLAQEGATAYPDSVGGKTCLAEYKQIEAPELGTQAMRADGPNRRSFALDHKNLATAYFRAYPFDLDRRIRTARDYNLLPDDADFQALLKNQSPSAEWKVELPATPDFQTHRTYVTPPMTRNGFYMVIVSGSPTFDPQQSRLTGLDFQLTGMAVTARRSQSGDIEATVLEGDSGQPAAGATVELWRYDYGRAHTRVDTRTVDANGLAQFPWKEGLQQYNHFLLARRGADLALDAAGVNFYRWGPQQDQSPRTLVFTDRAIYRPLQKILWKVVAYAPDGPAHYQVKAATSVTVTLKDPNNQVVDTKTVQTNDYGSAAGEFAVPSGRLLGSWRIETTPSGGASVRVEEYKRPTFEASFDDAKAPLRLNQPAQLTGRAKYYFGLPVTGGKVKWRVTRENVYPWWWFYWFTGGGAGQSQVIATGSSTLTDDGSFTVGFTPAADEQAAHARDLTYAYAIDADVTDEGGETRQAARSYRLGFVSVEAKATLEEAFFTEGGPVSMSISRTNLDGVGRAGKGTWRILQLKQPDRAVTPADLPQPRPPAQAAGPDAPPTVRTPGDRLRARWDADYQPDRVMADWADGAEVAAGEVQHGADGLGQVSARGLAPGAYRLRYQTVDDFGAKYDTFQDFLVAGARTPLALPLVFAAQRSSARVGETARFLLTSGLPDQRIAWDLYRSGKRVERRYLTAGKERGVIELPVGEGDRGGFTVVVTALRDYQLMRIEASVFVPWDDKELAVSFDTFRDTIRPGGQEHWRVSLKSKGKKDAAGAAAEVLALMYDQSLDVFGKYQPPEVSALYPNRTGSDPLQSSLGEVGGVGFWDSHFPVLPSAPGLGPDRVTFLDRYGVGGPGLRRRLFFRGGPVSTAAPPPEVAGRVMISQDKIALVEKAPPAPPPAPKPPSGEPPPAASPGLRSNFSETAFWRPQLIADASGAVAIDFTVPDSVTSWNVWVSAITRDLRGGQLERHTRSVKDLMVRPYVPRFLREGDLAQIKVVVNDASDKPFSGRLKFDIVDADTQQSVLGEFGLSGGGERAFTVAPGKGTDLTFAVTAPKRVGQVAFKVVATAGDLSDGELRPVPLLPSRLHLSQSRFATLHDADKRTLTFDDLRNNDDPTRLNEQLVVTIDGQLFYTVLQSLPYLTRYPYECSEQTLNRFVSTGIVSTLYQDYPAIQKMAQQMSTRDTVLETFDAADPNRKMALEETPWLQEAQGGKKAGDSAIDMLDARVTQAERDSALSRLSKLQTASGGFPWFPGGPPSPYMTLYVMNGLARAAEFGVAIPQPMTQSGWSYLATHFREEYQSRLKKDEASWEFLTFLDYAATAYPDPSYTQPGLSEDEKRQILDYGFKHWRQHSPLLKGYLALTLKRMGRPADAQLVWKSVMDSAKTTRDEGTFWAREDRSWLWYNDTIETHAFALRTLIELSPEDSRRHGLVQWLLLNKKLNHWKSTRATAEVIYSLVKYLQKEGGLGVREEIQASVGPQTRRFVFEPDEYTGKKNQWVIPGPEVKPQSATIGVEKSTPGFAFASATWQFSTDRLPTEESGDFFKVSRSYFKREHGAREAVLRPLAEGEPLRVGDELEVQLSIRSKHEAEYVHLKDPRGAGLEPENAVSRYKWDLGLIRYEEVRDSGANFFIEHMPVGQYTLTYRLRANMAGTFRVGPATLQSMYAPEFNAYSAGNRLEVREAQ